MQSRFQIEVENLKKTAQREHQNLYKKKKTLVNKRWPTPPNADANARTPWENQVIGKYKLESYIIRCLTPPGFELKTHQALIEDLTKDGTLYKR